ncbi:MAG: Hsp20/alpha crystallin family protein [Desulfomonilia bacterium]|jgi:HSP20 family molecular chaperone IbpA
MSNKELPHSPGGLSQRSDAGAAGRRPYPVPPAAATRFTPDFFTSFDLLPLTVFEEAGRFAPAISIMQSESSLVLEADLPGIRTKDLEIALSPGMLVISVKENPAPEWGCPLCGSFRRTVPLPFPADPRDVEATFINGTLQVVVSRRKGPLSAGVRIPLKKS